MLIENDQHYVWCHSEHFSSDAASYFTTRNSRENMCYFTRVRWPMEYALKRLLLGTDNSRFQFCTRQILFMEVGTFDFLFFPKNAMKVLLHCRNSSSYNLMISWFWFMLFFLVYLDPACLEVCIVRKFVISLFS